MKTAIPGCVLCTGEHKCVRHKHLDGGILALLGPKKEDDDYHLALFWAEGDHVRHITLPLDDQQEADYQYHCLVCTGTTRGAREVMAELLKGPHNYGQAPPRPDRCGHCKGVLLEKVPDLFGDYWKCFQCGWTSDAVSIPPEILEELEGLRLLAPRMAGGIKVQARDHRGHSLGRRWFGGFGHQSDRVQRLGEPRPLHTRAHQGTSA